MSSISPMTSAVESWSSLLDDSGVSIVLGSSDGRALPEQLEKYYSMRHEEYRKNQKREERLQAQIYGVDTPLRHPDQEVQTGTVERRPMVVTQADRRSRLALWALDLALDSTRS